MFELDIVEAMRQVNEWESSNSSATPLRIKIFRNYSIEFIEPFLKYYFGTLGLRCEISFNGFDSLEQDICSAQDIGKYDLVILSLTGDAFMTGRHEGNTADTAFARLAGVVEQIQSRTPAPLVLNTLTRPLLNEGGAVYAIRPDSLTSRVEEFNCRLRALVSSKSPRCLLVDWERIVMLIGIEAAFDRRMDYMAAAPFRHVFLNLYAREIFRIGRMLRGLGKKCVIVDCDNTLWGGVVGEAGLDGIELNPYEYPGRAFYDFQHAVLRLADEGIMVALCSKNNADDVMAVLDKHPHCLIKRDHLVGSRVNWDDKERNIQELVTDLNIGMDAVVVVDDSPLECARIKAFLPNISVRPVPEKLHELALLLDREGLFDKLTTTKEDLARTEMYRGEEKRRETAKAFATADEFLASLDIRAQIRAAKRADIARISQLTQKTNQFNLTTRRYSEGEIEHMAAADDCAVYSLTARDRFGDLGLTGVFIARRDGAGAHIDTLLMSCRVLGRRLEDQFVVECLSNVNRRWRPTIWTAEYIKNSKNHQVADFWPRLGFKVAATEERKTIYSANAAALELQPIPFITVETS